MKNIVILISGRGSNMQAILETAQRDQWDKTVPARIAAVISNRPNAAGLEVARAAGIETVALDHRAYASREAFDAALADSIDRFQPSLVVLAGFMRVLGNAFVRRYEGRLLNIHPSLLPAFPGLDTHARALKMGVKLHGATVHFVTAELDDGPIVMQAAVPVLPGDDETALAQRVLAQEHEIYPRAVRWFLQDELSFQHGLIRHQHGLPQWQLQP